MSAPRNFAVLSTGSRGDLTQDEIDLAIATLSEEDLAEVGLSKNTDG